MTVRSFLSGRRRMRALVAVVVVVMLVALLIYGASLVNNFWGNGEYVSCRMGWYDPERTQPHHTMVWGTGDDPCASIPPCGDPQVLGAGPPCEPSVGGAQYWCVHTAKTASERGQCCEWASATGHTLEYCP